TYLSQLAAKGKGGPGVHGRNRCRPRREPPPPASGGRIVPPFKAPHLDLPQLALRFLGKPPCQPVPEQLAAHLGELERLPQSRLRRHVSEDPQVTAVVGSGLR